jgi:hypothetical protein
LDGSLTAALHLGQQAPDIKIELVTVTTRPVQFDAAALTRPVGFTLAGSDFCTAPEVPEY